MAWDLGSVVPLTSEVFDADGNLTDASAVVCTVSYFLSDGTRVEVEPPVSNPATGRYTADFVPSTAGLHTERWTSTSPATSRSDTFDVRPAEPGYIVSLSDAKAHLNKTAPDDDEELRPYIVTAGEVIEDHLGEKILPQTVREVRTLHHTTDRMVLGFAPVISLTSVATIDGRLIWNVADLDADEPTGIVRVLLGPHLHGDIRVVYVAGRAAVPERYKMAARMVISALWELQRPDTGGRRPVLGAGGGMQRADGQRYRSADFPEAMRLLGAVGGFA